MTPAAIPSFNLKGKFLDGQANKKLDISAPGAPSLLASLVSLDGTIPPGEMVLGDIRASAGGDGTLPFGGGLSAGSVTLSGSAGGAFSVGVYSDADAAIKALDPATNLLDGLALKAGDLNPVDLNPIDPASRFLVVRASYNINATAKGTVALGAGASATFGANTSGDGLFAVVHSFRNTDPAVQVFADTFQSWALPSQIRAADDLAPGTWLIAEVDGSFGLQAGVQAGYDFSWLRQLPNGALAGPLGLRVQLGAIAALGFSASGKYAVVLGREQADQVLRLRLYKLAKNGWNFALNAQVGVKAVLPPFFNTNNKAEDLVAAIFGLNNSQIIDVLKDTRAFVNSTESLNDKLAGVLADLGGSTLAEIKGLPLAQIETIYEAGRQRVLSFLADYNKLGHQITSMLLSLSGHDFTTLETSLQDIVNAGDNPQTQAVVTRLLNKAGFDRTPIGRFIEAGVGPALGVIANNAIAGQLRTLSGQTLSLLNGGTLQKLLDFVGTKVSLKTVRNIASQADLANVDNLLRSRLAAFLGKDQVVMADLVNIQSAVAGVFANVDKFYSAAISAARKQQQFSYAWTYSRSTTSTALLDISFDLAQPGAPGLLRQAVLGNFDQLLLQPADGVTLNSAELTHNIQRNVSSELTLPFGKLSDVVQTISSTGLNVTENNGRVLTYTLSAGDEESQMSLFRSQSGRNSTLTVAATLPVTLRGDLHVWSKGTYSYAYKLERATQRMRVGQLNNEFAPLVTKYLPNSFTPAADFSTWAQTLGRHLNSGDPTAIGDTLVTLELSAPPEYLEAWTSAPPDKLSVEYLTLSRRLQAKIRELITFYYFSDPGNYANLDAAAAPIIFSCLPISTAVKFDPEKGTLVLNQPTGLHWYDPRSGVITAKANHPATKAALAGRLVAIQASLHAAGMDSVAKQYAPNEFTIRSIIAAATKPTSPGNPEPALLGGLLFLEAQLVDVAANIGIEMSAFRADATTNPAGALTHLAEFGEVLVSAFNRGLSGTTFFSGVGQALGNVLFLEASSLFMELNGTPAQKGFAASMDVTVIRTDSLSAGDMLAGKITPDLVLFEQPFVQASLPDVTS